MPFDWREFLIVAHSLRKEASEGVQRTCIGRTYYYVYNLGLGKARALGFTKQPPSLHKELWKWCQNHADQNIRQIGVWGNRLHSLRLDADYSENAIPNLAGEVMTQLTRAQRFEGLVAESNGKEPPTALPR